MMRLRARTGLLQRVLYRFPARRAIVNVYTLQVPLRLLLGYYRGFEKDHHK